MSKKKKGKLTLAERRAEKREIQATSLENENLQAAIKLEEQKVKEKFYQEIKETLMEKKTELAARVYLGTLLIKGVVSFGGLNFKEKFISVRFFHDGGFITIYADGEEKKEYKL